MAVTTDSFTEGRLRERLGEAPPRREDGTYLLAGANLARLSLTKAQLHGADLRAASLLGCDLMRADLGGADLRGADLSDSKLQLADLTLADLRAALLRNAVLNGTKVYGARFAGANLSRALLRGVALWETDLEPGDLEAAGEVDFADALRAADPGLDSVVKALDWMTLIGGDHERYALQQLLRQRAWRRWQRRVRDVVRAIDQRIGPLSSRSISLAAPSQATDRSVSRAATPAEGAGPRSLSRLPGEAGAEPAEES
ncbi:MAG: pentapeptide repeat-containing protein [Armatimonadetes bacterium]|nr:pentapeptide repeat-containing protein [Armatimonadota bacterium]